MLKRIGLLFFCLLVVIPDHTFASTEKRLSEFVDTYFERKMKEDHVPGAVISIVKDGKIQLLKGYGFADLEKKTPVDPNQTVFRVGSLAKLFTATSMMQLYERGLLDLNKDIKEYIPELKLEYINHLPVTSHHLLTHTAGFYEKLYAIGRDQKKQLPLSTAIQTYLPKLERVPGKEIQYSNHGMSLAGYMVERISKQTFEAYAKENIFKPLNMQSTSFYPSDTIAERLAKSYSYADGNFIPIPYSHIHFIPSGALNSTAVDMSHFMIAHLQNGKFENERILTEKTSKFMHSQKFTSHEDFPGTAYGFFERFHNGLHLIEHNGGMDGFHSNFHLLPSENTGIFISANSDSGYSLIHEFIDEYLDFAYPSGKNTATKMSNPNPKEELQQVSGYYVPNEAFTNDPTMFLLNLKTFKITAMNDGELAYGSNGSTETFFETNPYLFTTKNGGQSLYFNKEHNVITFNGAPSVAFHQMPAFYHPFVHIGILLSFAMIYPIQLVFTLLSFLYRKLRKRAYEFDWISSLVSVLFIVYFLFIISTPELFINEIPIWSYPLLSLPVIALSLLCIRLVTRTMKKQKSTIRFYLFSFITLLFNVYLFFWHFFNL